MFKINFYPTYSQTITTTQSINIQVANFQYEKCPKRVVAAKINKIIT